MVHVLEETDLAVTSLGMYGRLKGSSELLYRHLVVDPDVQRRAVV